MAVLPLDVAYWTVTGLVEAFDSVTVNVMLEVPLLPSFLAALPIEMLG